jgi:hypothetical protein
MLAAGAVSRRGKSEQTRHAGIWQRIGVKYGPDILECWWHIFYIIERK